MPALRTFTHLRRLGLAAAALMLLAIGLVCVASRSDSNATRDPYVSFFYMAPFDTLHVMYGERPEGDVDPTGFDERLLTADRVGAFRRHAPQNLVKTFDALQPGTPLRKRIDELLQINGGVTDVDYYLMDDRRGINSASADAQFSLKPRSDGKNFIWPATFIQKPGSDGQFTAVIGLGTSACDSIVSRVAGGWKAWEGTIVHETSHTQFVGTASRWAAINVIYGSDQAHFWSELLGDQELTYEEGLGNFYGLLDNPAWAQTHVVDFFRRADERYFLDSRSLLTGRPEVWDAPHTERIIDDPQKFPKKMENKTGSYVIRRYKWNDVPGFYILFNETTSTAFHYFYWKYAVGNPDTALAMIERSETPMTRTVRKKFLAFSVNRLALDLENLATKPAGQALRKDGKLTSSMFPYALLDVLTHFGMTEDKYQRELITVYPDRQPKAFKEYWARRDAVRQLVSANLSADPIQIDEAVHAIHDYFRRDDTILASAP